MKKFWSKLLLCLIAVLMVTTGFSSWIFASSFQTEGVTNNRDIPEAFIVSDPNTKYTSIEKAVEVANSKGGNQEVVVLMNPTAKEYLIERDITLNSGVSLKLPCDGSVGNFIYNYPPDSGYGSNHEFADDTEESVKANLKINVRVKDNVKITINPGASITIGGYFGTNHTTGLVSQTCANYSQIVLGKNSIILNNGQLNCYGYIKEATRNNGSLVKSVTGTIAMPMIITDLGGGSNTAISVQQSDVAPFRCFEFVNIQSQLQFMYGSMFDARFRLTANIPGSNGKVVTKESSVIVIAPDTYNKQTIFRLKKRPDGQAPSYAYLKYDTNNDHLLTRNSIGGRTQVKLFGDTGLQNLKLDINVMSQNIIIDSANFMIPISWKFDIELLPNSTCTADAHVKLLPGSDFLIRENSTFNVNSQFIIYSDYITNGVAPNTQPYPYSDTAGVYKNHIANPKYNGGASFINNGTVNVNGSHFGGFVKSTRTGSTIKFAKDTNTCSAAEMFCGYNIDGFISGKVTRGVLPIKSTNEAARGIVLSNGIKQEMMFDTDVVYTYENDAWVKPGQGSTSKQYMFALDFTIVDKNRYTGRSGCITDFTIYRSTSNKGANEVRIWGPKNNCGSIPVKDGDYIRVTCSLYGLGGKGKTDKSLNHFENGSGYNPNGSNGGYVQINSGLDTNNDGKIILTLISNDKGGYLPL